MTKIKITVESPRRMPGFGMLLPCAELEVCDPTAEMLIGARVAEVIPEPPKPKRKRKPRKTTKKTTPAPVAKEGE